MVVLFALSVSLLVAGCQRGADAEPGAGPSVQPVVQASRAAGGDALPADGAPDPDDGDLRVPESVPAGGTLSGPGAGPQAGAPAPAGVSQPNAPAPVDVSRADPAAPADATVAAGPGQAAPAAAPSPPAQTPVGKGGDTLVAGEPAPPAPAPAPPPVGGAEPPAPPQGPPPADVAAPAPNDAVVQPPRGGPSLLPGLADRLPGGQDSVPGPNILSECEKDHSCDSASPVPPTNPLDKILRRAGIRK